MNALRIIYVLTLVSFLLASGIAHAVDGFSIVPAKMEVTIEGDEVIP